MKRYKITEEIQKLKPKETKAYYYLYADSGFELGFGKGGTYAGHSHLYFCDILFSTKPIETSDGDGKIISDNLIVIPPKTYVGEVVTDDFFFIKFCPTNDRVILPDKIESVERVGLISGYSNEVNIVFPWFKNHLSSESLIKLELNSNNFQINLGNNNSFHIF